MALSASCKVYIAFADGPLVASPTWTEVTSYVRSVRTSRGRTNELEEFSAGTATVVLNNRDRRFDPDYSSSPYSPNVKVRRQLKIEAVHSGVTYPVFRGLIQNWQQSWPANGRDATTTVQCSDLFALLATWDAPDTAHELYARSSSPSAWWPLDDDDNVARDLVGTAAGSYRSADREKVDAIEAGGAGASLFESDPTYTPTSIDMATWAYYASASNKTTVSCMFQAQGGSFYLGSTMQPIGFDYANGSCRLSVSADGLVTVRFAYGLFVAQAAAEAAVVDGNPHHLLMVRDGTNVALYVDGVSVATASGASTNNASGKFSGYVGRSSYKVSGVVLDEAVLWHGTAITSGQAAILADAALTGWAKQRADARISRMLDTLGVPSALYSMQTASSSVGAFAGGTDALTVLQSTARSDQGRLYVNRSGVIVFEAKTDDMGATSAATFADDTTANAVRYNGFDLELSDGLVYNDVTVTGTDVSFNKQAATSITTYSRRALSWDTELPTAAACRDVAENLATRYADPVARGRSWTVHPERTLIGSTTRAWATVLGRELGDIVTVKRSPSTGTALSKTLQVTSIAHEITPDDWTVTFAGAPAYTTSSFRWGTSNWGGTDYWS